MLSEKTLGLKIKPTKCEIFFLVVTSPKNVDRHFWHLSIDFNPGSGSEHQAVNHELIILDSPLGLKLQRAFLEETVLN